MPNNAQDSAEVSFGSLSYDVLFTSSNSPASQYNQMYVDITKTSTGRVKGSRCIIGIILTKFVRVDFAARATDLSSLSQNAIKAYSAAHRTALEVDKEAKTSIEDAKRLTGLHSVPLNFFTKMLPTILQTTSSFDEIKKCLGNLQTMLGPIRGCYRPGAQ